MNSANTSSTPSPDFLRRLRSCHLVGAGGVGVGALGEILLDRGVALSGSDLIENALTRRLCARGAHIHTGHAPEHLPQDAECVVYSNAAAQENPELAAARALGIPCFRRGEFLAGWVATYQNVIAVSGSHGKTGITALIVHLLDKCGAHCGYMIGGSVAGRPSGRAGDGTIFVTEADESDGSHAALHSTLAVIPNADDDHAWSVGGGARLVENFRRFAANAKAVLGHTAAIPPAVRRGHPAFTDLPLSGDFVRDNRALALEAVRRCGFAPAETMLEDFPGVERRLSVRRSEARLTVIEDYAHAPAELRATLGFLRGHYPGHHLRVLFQPHRYARLALYFKEFSQLLATADSRFVAPVFAAWSEQGSVNAADLARAAGAQELSVLDNAAAERLLASPADGRPLLLAVIGAGDVNRILPLLL